MTASPPRRYTAEELRRYEDIARRMVEDRKSDGAIGWGAEAWKVWQVLADMLSQSAEDASRLEQIEHWANEQAREGEKDRPWQWGYSDAQACVKGILAALTREAPEGR